MPKLKTHRGAAKRFSFTASGKVKYKRAGLRHLLHQEDSGSKRQRGRAGYLSDADRPRIEKKLPYGR